MSGEVGARAISHLEEVSDDGIAAMAAAQVVAVLLPTTAYVLRLKCPPARKMIDKGITQTHEWRRNKEEGPGSSLVYSSIEYHYYL